MKMNKIFVLGSINIDFVYQTNRLPKRGETIKSEKFFMATGGKGANQAVAAAKQQAETIMLGSISNDELSRICLDSLALHNVNTKFIEIYPDVSCGNALVILENNDNRIITSSGANKFHNTNKIEHILNDNSMDNDLLLAQLEIPLEVIQDAFIKAKALNMITVLNAAPATKLPESLLLLVDYLIINETEIETLTKQKVQTEKSQIEALDFLLEQGVKNIILTLGKAGSIYYNGKTMIKIPAYIVKVVDTTAAGDTYIGVLSASLALGKNINQAMTYATAASALAIQKLGAQPSIPNRDSVEKFLKEKRNYVEKKNNS
jgi:ribokinase